MDNLHRKFCHNLQCYVGDEWMYVVLKRSLLCTTKVTLMRYAEYWEVIGVSLRRVNDPYMFIDQ